MQELKKSTGDSSLKKPLLIALITMLVLLTAWHLVFPIIGAAIVITAAAWAVIMMTIVFVAVAVLLFYIFSALGILILCAVSSIWIILAIAIFPFIFPLLIPLLILLIFMAFIRRRKAQ